MKLKLPDNGNVSVLNGFQVSSSIIDFDNRSWFSNTDSAYNNSRTGASNNYILYGESTLESTEAITEYSSDVNTICNKQYKLNENKTKFILSRDTVKTNLVAAPETVFAVCNGLVDETNASSITSPIKEDRVFKQSDIDEMSDTGPHYVLRGIVNPNYPGFQHLAHTLQEYSLNIDNFYQSENEMTDDDIDVEIIEANYEPEYNQNDTSKEYKSINNNNGEEDHDLQTDLTPKYEFMQSRQDIPDLLKTVSQNNNNIKSESLFDHECTDTDIENNFHTNDIIGDFNKEIEDEIKLLLNYNINIQDDLEELRKDIQDTFAKPIENTINNISEVVNHVIKKLVKTQNDCYDHIDGNLTTNINQQTIEVNANKKNETNTPTEMNFSRPTFLVVENIADHKITDAFLSDGKEDININYEQFDPEILTNNVEKTIQQLSTELRKIIPKLDEMRENDRIWAESQQVTPAIITDPNSNELASSSGKSYEVRKNSTPDRVKNFVERISHKKQIIEPEVVRKRSKETRPARNSFRKTQSNASVLKIEKTNDYDLESFDVYNIETALPKLDLDAIESHLKAAKQAERRKRNDREEIRRRLAMGADAEEFYSMGHIDRPGKKPSLQSRLQNGKNLQICFMNETASDNEQTSDVERNASSTSLSRSSVSSKSNFNHPYQTRPLSVNITKSDKVIAAQTGAKFRPSSLTLKTPKSRLTSTHSLGHIELKESDFFALQATLQTEARIALAQAKEMARIQMERERRSRAASPVTEMLRHSLAAAGVPLAPDRRRASRQLLTDMNIAQLQVIVNSLHSQIETLNESLVSLLMARDELHMGQDSMLVDIEDLTRYLGVKEQTKTKGKSGVRRLTSFVNK